MFDHGINLSDEVIKARAATDGIIACLGVGSFLNKERTIDMEEIVEHVNYVSELVGRRHSWFFRRKSITCL